jgi:hypothetical protein
MGSGTEAERRLSLLLIMLRVTRNSYEAASFLISTVDGSPKRKKEFIMVLPPINRQLLDLLFTLVFMMDDFEKRSMDYELASYRQAREEYDKFHRRYATHLRWQSRLRDLGQWLETMEKYLAITPEQKAKPSIIPYWYAPYRLMKSATNGQPFMQFLEKWLYGETSAQAHLNPAGLFSMGLFVFADFASETEPTTITARNLERFTFRHFSRTLITVLAISSEIDNFCKLNNRETLARLWVLLGGYADEADDVYKGRYQTMLT